ncbi:MAG: hypothetical protein KJ621_07610 [Proteobacteria bacterium]|nr:hypothetical protein [Pseudomonadota bacterium]
MEAERKAREAADARITPAQLRYRAGDIVVSDSGYGFPIFHEILDIEQEVKKQLWKYGDDHESDGIYTLDLYREPHMRFYRFARNYSEACQEGELGDFHLSIGMARITREGFEELRERGFSLEPYQE